MSPALRVDGAGPREARPRDFRGDRPFKFPITNAIARAGNERSPRSIRRPPYANNLQLESKPILAPQIRTVLVATDLQLEAAL